MHVELARAGRPRDVHRVVVMHRHVQDCADVVHVALRHCAPATRYERLERDDQRAFLQVEEFWPDRLVDCTTPLSPEATEMGKGGWNSRFSPKTLLFTSTTSARAMSSFTRELSSMFACSSSTSPVRTPHIRARIIMCARCSHAISAGFSISSTPNAEQPLCSAACSTTFPTPLPRSRRSVSGRARARDNGRETSDGMSSP